MRSNISKSIVSKSAMDTICVTGAHGGAVDMSYLMIVFKIRILQDLIVDPSCLPPAAVSFRESMTFWVPQSEYMSRCHRSEQLLPRALALMTHTSSNLKLNYQYGDGSA